MTSLRQTAFACCLPLGWLVAIAAFASDSTNPARSPTPPITTLPMAWLSDRPLAPADLDFPSPAEALAIDPHVLGPLLRLSERQEQQPEQRKAAEPTANSESAIEINKGKPPGNSVNADGAPSTPWTSWLALSLLSVAPAALLMTTSYVRISAVLGLLRQALGMPQLPSSMVISSLSLFMTFLVMAPVWTEVYEEAIVPARDPDRQISWDEFWTKGSKPLRRFMSRQIDRADNSEDVWLFYRHLPESRTTPTPSTYDDVPLAALLPAFLLSELKIAFLIGFQICLPFLVVDLVVASMTTALGMMMVPTQAISLPVKLLLFVLLDGWRLVIGMLLESFQT
jgi:flagellar biosynthetic protein FliP